MIIHIDLIFQETAVFKQHFYSLGSSFQPPISDLRNSSVKFSVILGQGPNIFPSASHQSYLKHKLMSAWSPSRKMCLPSPHGALPSCPHTGSWSEVLHLCPHAGPGLPSPLLFWNVLPDSAPPLRLLLSVLKYQSLPYEVRRATPAVPARQGNAGIS